MTNLNIMENWLAFVDACTKRIYVTRDQMAGELLEAFSLMQKNHAISDFRLYSLIEFGRERQGEHQMVSASIKDHSFVASGAHIKFLEHINNYEW